MKVAIGDSGLARIDNPSRPPSPPLMQTQTDLECATEDHRVEAHSNLVVISEDRSRSEVEVRKAPALVVKKKAGEKVKKGVLIAPVDVIF